MQEMFENKSILVTGGTGSFGKAFIGRLMERHPELKKIVVFSRDELKQFEFSMAIPAEWKSKLRFFLGDVRDRDRMLRALEGIDYVIHAAALKQVPAAEYNPMEFIKTNVMGAENIINACLEQGVSRVVALSTDKAAAPVNLYGATKLCSDKLFVAANNVKGARDIRFSAVRYGNVMGSRGSVIPFFLQARNKGELPITDPEMTRFNITLGEGVDMVLYALEKQWGGEIFVPKIPSYRIMDVAEAIAPGIPTRIVGIRPGEKVHEEMITEADSYSTVDLGPFYAILPQVPSFNLDDYLKNTSAIKVIPGFKYNSGTNAEWLSVEALRSLITQHVDPDFAPL